MKTAKSRRHNLRNHQSKMVNHAQGAQNQPAEEMILQFGQNEITIPSISEKVKNSYKESGSQAEIRDIKIYVKPEENKAYYVINGDCDGSVNLA